MRDTYVVILEAMVQIETWFY